MDAREQAAIEKGQELAAACQAAVGSDREVTWAMLGWQGPKPSKRVLALASVLLPLLLLLVLPPLVAVGITVVYGVVVALVTSRIWTTRIVALTADSAFVLDRVGKGEPGAVVGTAQLQPAANDHDMWRVYDQAGATIWVPKPSIEAYEASIAPAPSAS